MKIICGQETWRSATEESITCRRKDTYIIRYIQTKVLTFARRARLTAPLRKGTHKCRNSLRGGHEPFLGYRARLKQVEERGRRHAAQDRTLVVNARTAAMQGKALTRGFHGIHKRSCMAHGHCVF